MNLVKGQLRNADQELQKILKYKIGSIIRLSTLLNGNVNLQLIWTEYKEKIRSPECL
jgi:hypothetical protein